MGIIEGGISKRGGAISVYLAVSPRHCYDASSEAGCGGGCAESERARANCQVATAHCHRIDRFLAGADGHIANAERNVRGIRDLVVRGTETQLATIDGDIALDGLVIAGCVAERECAGADGGGAAEAVVAGERESAGARLGEAAAGTSEGAGEARGGVVGADADGVVSEIQVVAALDGPDLVGVGTGHAEGHRLRAGGAGIELGVLKGVHIPELERAAADGGRAGVGVIPSI